MSTRVCGRCRRPLPAPASEGAAPAPCPFCAAQGEAGRATASYAGRAPQSRQPAPTRDEPGAGKKRAEAFASALVENATRTTPVHSFAVPPEAIPVVHQPRRREPPPPPTPPPVVLPPPPAPLVTILPPSPAPPVAVAPAPRRAAVTATLASLGPGPFTPQTRPAASPAASSLAAAFAVEPDEQPVAAPAVAPAPYLVPVPTPTPAPVPQAAAPVAKAAPAASLAETMLSLAPQVSERGADAWNISPYLDGADAPPAPTSTPEPAPASIFAPAPSSGAIAEAQPSPGSEPVDLQIRSGLSALLHRLPGRGLGMALGAALLVAVIGGAAFVLLGGPRHSSGGKSGAAARVAAAPAKAAPLPSLAMPPIAEPPAAPPAPSAPKAAKADEVAKARAPEPEAAPPPVEEEAPIAAAPARSHARSEAKSKAVSKHAAHHASATSSGHGGGHRRTTARARVSDGNAAATDESDKMARVRDAYREGNERLFSGDAAGAITAYEEMVRLNPQDPAGYRGLGLASAQLGKRTEAVRYLRAYLKHAPDADDRGIIIGRISLLQTLPP